jgi:plasmid stabilization system protein ParE
MRYTVEWLPSAVDELATIWNDAADRQAVSRAADQIEVLLRTSSQVRGGNGEGTHAYTIFPLAVIFEVSPDDRKVTVLEVFHLS